MSEPTSAQPRRQITRMIVMFACLVTLGISAAALSARQSTVSTHAAKRTQAASVGTLQPLVPDAHWHAVLQLGNDGPVARVGGAFEATNTYSVFVACKGSGHLTYTSSSGSSTITCASTPQLFAIPTLPLAGKQVVQVSVTADSAVTWRALVEVQD